MFPYIAIPSYNRPDTIGQKTLKFLHLSGYPASRIHIFVADDAEFKKYTDALDEDLYDEIIVGVKGLKDQRNFITSFYKEDEVIIQMDDDVKGIRCNLSFLNLVELGLASLEYRSAGLWGVMPNDDARRFKDATTKHLTHILGSFFMMRNHKDIKMTYTEKEDMERSILYFRRYGQVLRYQNAGVCTTYGKGKGGLQTPGRDERIKSEILRFQTEYPEYINVVDKKGIQDIILNWRASQTKTPGNDDDHSHLSLPKK
jgi:hypothetical protein